MKVLLEDRFAPITSCIGFFDASLESVGSALLDWRKSLGGMVTRQAVKEPFADVLHCLEPLTTVVRQRELLLATRSSWTAYFDSFATGTDASGVVGHLCTVLRCRGVTATCVPNTLTSEGRGMKGRYGAVIFELYGPGPTEWLNYVRTITAANDGGRWVFHTFGTILPFEQSERYTARKIADRFTAEMLEQYCAALGVQYFNPDFYKPEGLLLADLRPLPNHAEAFSLTEAQSRLGIGGPS
jgi:hypothetical protein